MDVGDIEALSVPPGAVVVGVEQSAEAGGPLRYGLAEARRRDLPVHVVTVYQPSLPWMWGLAASGAVPADEEPAADLAVVEAAVAELVASARASLHGESGADTPAPELHTVLGRPSEVLLACTGEAAALVVGQPNRGAIGAAVLGSVGLSCVAHAACPVIVVPSNLPEHQEQQD